MLWQNRVGMATGSAFITDDHDSVSNRKTVLKRNKKAFIGSMLLPVRMCAGTEGAGVIVDADSRHGLKECFIRSKIY
ncbi:hypothetical protein [Anaerobium acetethylicum]|uniref:hypothetical protein n=1 Tax=Anaerobium acetethylicum TaxID=1619234 RepID=UPI000B87AD0C|nr:hypothetical protein [Anaerobium acetethylicum]